MKKLILKITILIGVAGFVLFFPVNIGNRYTCLYHRLFDTQHDYCPVYNETSVENEHRTMHQPGESEGFIQLYIHKYAWFWWASFAGLMAVILVRLNKNQEETV